MARLALNIGSLLLVGGTSGVTVCLVVLMALLFYQMSNTGSAADWVSSLCNVAMALTAFGALLVARRWLPQLTTQEGYKEAIRLVNEQYIQLGPDNGLRLGNENYCTLR